MNFHPLNKRLHYSRGTKVFIFFLVIVFIFVALNIVEKGALSGALRTRVGILEQTKIFIQEGTAPLSDLFTSTDTLRQENISLKKQLTQFELYALNNKALVIENTDLRGLLSSLKSETAIPRVMEHVLSRIGLFPSGTILISRDSKDPYPVGSYVIQKQNIVLGTVIEVHTHTALVQLISAPGVETSVIIGNAKRTVRATVRGTGNGNMVTEIDRNIDIRINDPVVLYGKGTLIVGYVGAIRKKPIDALQRVYIRVPLNLSTVQFVLVQNSL